jgi:hypothetical protein
MLSAASPAAACPGPPPVYVAVLIDDAAVQTRTDFTLAQIESMRRQVGGPDRHPNLGFYGHRFGYTVDVEPVTLAGGTCVESVKVTVKMALSQRVIEIGKDLLKDPCLFAIAQAHYQRHAAADDVVFSQYMKTIEPTLHAAQLLPPGHDYTIDALDPKAIEARVHVAIDASLVPYDTARSAAQRGVDTRNEAEKMTSGCPSAPSPENRHT